MSDGYHIDDELQQRAYDAHLMRRLLMYVRPYRRSLALATVLLLLTALFSSVVPWLNWKAIAWYINNPERISLQQEVDSQHQAETPARASLTDQTREDKRDLLVLIGVTAGLLIAEALARYFHMIIVAIIGQKSMFRMRMDVFEHLQKMSLQFLDKNPIGRLVTRVTNDVEKIQETIVSGVVQSINDLFVIVVVLGFMAWNNWRLTLITLSPIPVVFITGWLFRRYARASYLEVRKKIAGLNAHMQENLSGMRIVQMFRREDDAYEEYRRRNALHRDEWFRQIEYYARYFPIVDFLGTLSLALIVFYGGRQILRMNVLTGGVADIGMFFAYVEWSERLYGPIRALADRYNLILEAMASSERVFELLDTPEQVPDAENAFSPTRIEGRVEFDNVSFAYVDEQWVLKNVTLDVKPGERIAVVGHTGAGKTSLINVLSRFYDIQKGSIRVEGRAINEYSKTALRRAIGVVLQDVFLFSGTIEDNIRLGDASLTPAKIRACAEYVNAARFIDRLPEKYQYSVGERGANLSTGQRQLVAFARALAFDPQILVLDEATSSVDPETESLIQDAIGKLMEGRTSIVIAHRLSTVRHANRIVVMHHGEIREMGTHQELLAKRGLYYTLYRLQYKDQESRD